MFEEIQEVNGQIVNNKWIEWDHIGIPNSPKPYREVIRFIFALLNHCLNCTALDGCYFVERNMPKLPHHENCDCMIRRITSTVVKTQTKAECPIKKITNYVFANDTKSKGKKAIFESLGFTIDDSHTLKNEIENQSLKNYLLGNYILKNSDMYGQRLAIRVNIAGKSFYTGWLLEPEGKIRNTTPFGGWIK